MGDAGLVELRAAAAEACTLVEGRRVELRVQHRLPIAARTGGVEQCIEHGAADAGVTRRGRDRKGR